MKAFICHNKADKASARLIALLLVGQGADVWFDEWDLQPGCLIYASDPNPDPGKGNEDDFTLESWVE